MLHISTQSQVVVRNTFVTVDEVPSPLPVELRRATTEPTMPAKLEEEVDTGDENGLSSVDEEPDHSSGGSEEDEASADEAEARRQKEAAVAALSAPVSAATPTVSFAARLQREASASLDSLPGLVKERSGAMPQFEGDGPRIRMRNTFLDIDEGGDFTPPAGMKRAMTEPSFGSLPQCDSDNESEEDAQHLSDESEEELEQAGGCGAPPEFPLRFGSVDVGDKSAGAPVIPEASPSLESLPSSGPKGPAPQFEGGGARVCTRNTFIDVELVSDQPKMQRATTEPSRSSLPEWEDCEGAGESDTEEEPVSPGVGPPSGRSGAVGSSLGAAPGKAATEGDCPSAAESGHARTKPALQVPPNVETVTSQEELRGQIPIASTGPVVGPGGQLGYYMLVKTTGGESQRKGSPAVPAAPPPPAVMGALAAGAFGSRYAGACINWPQGGVQIPEAPAGRTFVSASPQHPAGGVHFQGESSAMARREAPPLPAPVAPQAAGPGGLRSSAVPREAAPNSKRQPVRPSKAAPQVTPLGTSSASQPAVQAGRAAPQELSSKPQLLAQDFDANTGILQVRWNVDARKLRGCERQAVSPTFNLQCGGLAEKVPFKMIIYPKAGSDTAMNFRKSRGLGYVLLKCEAEVPEANANVEFRLSIGNGPKAQEARGPINHNFSRSALCGLPEKEQEWNFTDAVDQRSSTFPIVLEIIPCSDA